MVEPSVGDNAVPVVNVDPEKVAGPSDDVTSSEVTAEIPTSLDSANSEGAIPLGLPTEQPSVVSDVPQENSESAVTEYSAEAPRELPNTEQTIPESVPLVSEDIPEAPLYQEQSPFLSEQSDVNPIIQQPISPTTGQISALPPDVGGIKGFDPANKYNKRFVYIIFGSVVGLLVLILLGFLGYNFYISSSNERILGLAAKNIINSKNIEVDFSVGVDSFSLNGKLYVDKTQNLKFLVSVSGFSLEALYLKEKDIVYLKELDLFGSGTSTESKAAYYEGKNVEKAINKYSTKDLGLDSLNPTKDYFSSENMKHFKREDDEKRDGIDLYKYSFVANEADIKKATDQANTKIAEYSPDIKVKHVKNTTTLLIKKSDFTLYRVDGNTEISYSQKMPDTSKCLSLSYEEQTTCADKAPTKEQTQKYVFKWALDIKGGYKDTIALPKGSTISQSVDLSTYEDDIKKTTNDSERKSNSWSIETALETYYIDNKSYPTKLALLVPDYLKSLPKNPGDTKFLYVAKDNGYTLSVKLENPDKNDSNVKNGSYIVTKTADQINVFDMPVPTEVNNVDLPVSLLE